MTAVGGGHSPIDPEDAAQGVQQQQDPYTVEGEHDSTVLTHFGKDDELPLAKEPASVANKSPGVFDRILAFLGLKTLPKDVTPVVADTTPKEPTGVKAFFMSIFCPTFKQKTDSFIESSNKMIEDLTAKVPGGKIPKSTWSLLAPESAQARMSAALDAAKTALANIGSDKLKNLRNPTQRDETLKNLKKEVNELLENAEMLSFGAQRVPYPDREKDLFPHSEIQE